MLCYQCIVLVQYFLSIAVLGWFSYMKMDRPRYGPRYFKIVCLNCCLLHVYVF